MNYKTNMQLSIIDNLFREKEQELKRLSGNLQLNEVKEDADFEATKQRIKQQVLLEPIVFGEPKISNHYQTTRQVPPNYQNMWGGAQEVLIVTVDFPFTGSRELLAHSPNGVSVRIGRIYQSYGNSISIEVTLTKLDKAEAFAKAREEMRTTFEFAEANSKQAETWAQTMELLVDSVLEQKRKEVLDFYS